MQQDTFDSVDASVSLKRQKFSSNLVHLFISAEYAFDSQAEALAFFTKMTGLFKGLNYTHEYSTDYRKLVSRIKTNYQSSAKGQSELS